MRKAGKKQTNKGYTGLNIIAARCLSDASGKEYDAYGPGKMILTQIRAV